MFMAVFSSSETVNKFFVFMHTDIFQAFYNLFKTLTTNKENIAIITS